MSNLQGFDELIEGFSQLGQLLGGLISNEYSAFLLFMIFLWLIFFTLLKAVIGKVPMFEGDGDSVVNRTGGTLAASLSFLCVLSIGWATREQGPQYITNSLSGTFGYALAFIISILIGYLALKNTENFSKYIRGAIVALAAGVTFSLIWTFINPERGSFWFLFPLFFGIAALIAFAANHMGSD